MREDIENLINEDKDLNIETRSELDGKIIAEDFFNCMANDIDSFEKFCRENKEGFKSPNFPTFEEKLEGWSAGFYVFAGPSNAGKTAVMTNIADDLCNCEENKLFAIYYALDDKTNDIIPRVVAMKESIPINLVLKPARFEQMIIDGHPDSLFIQEQLNKRTNGLERLKKCSDKMMIKDTTTVKTLDDICTLSRQVHSYVKAIDPDMNIMLIVDSLKDVHLGEGYGKLTVNEKIDIVSKGLKDLSTELNCMLFASMHLRKLNANRRPTMDDLKDSNTLEYESNVCFLINNDVSRNKQSAKIFYREDTENAEKQQVIEVDWGKNKLSSYKGITFCNFAPDFSKCVECSKEASERYNSLIYEL